MVNSDVIEEMNIGKSDGVVSTVLKSNEEQEIKEEAVITSKEDIVTGKGDMYEDDLIRADENIEYEEEGANKKAKKGGATNKRSSSKAGVLDEFEVSFDRDINVNYIQTGLLPFDLLTGGKGLPLERLIHFWSKPGLGKTTSLCTLSKYLVSSAYPVLYGAVELSEELIKTMRLTTDKQMFKYITFSFYKDLEAITEAFLASHYTVFIIDSITAITPSPKAMKKNKGIESAVIGLDARIQTQWLKIVHNMLKKSGKTIIYITQSRKIINENLGWGADNNKPAGPEANLFFSHLQFVIKGKAKLKAADIGQKGDNAIGTEGYFYSIKNRFASPGVKIPVHVLFGLGLSNIKALMDYGLWSGEIVREGNSYICDAGGQKITASGNIGTMNWVKDNKDYLIDSFKEKGSDYYDWLKTSSFKSE